MKNLALVLIAILFLALACQAVPDYKTAPPIPVVEQPAFSPTAEPTQEPTSELTEEPALAPVTPAAVVQNKIRDDLKGKLSVLFINVGHGDSELIITPEGKTLLIDGGQYFAADDVASALNSLGIVKLDAIIATHPHKDHIGGLPEIISQFSPKEFFMLNMSWDSGEYMLLLSALGEAQVAPQYLRGGSEFSFGEKVAFDVLSPLKNSYNDLNDMSIVLRLIFEETSFLLAADMTETAEKDVLSKYGKQLNSTVLKVGHHGGNDASKKKFLQEVSPKYAVISADPAEKDLPSPLVLERLEAQEIEYYSTYANGNILIISDGKNIKIEKEK